MSRNLCRKECYKCEGSVALTGPPHPITADEAGAYYSEYVGMIVADAECEVCGAQYLAWVDEFFSRTNPPKMPDRFVQTGIVVGRKR